MSSTLKRMWYLTWTLRVAPDWNTAREAQA